MLLSTDLFSSPFLHGLRCEMGTVCKYLRDTGYIGVTARCGGETMFIVCQVTQNFQDVLLF